MKKEIKISLLSLLCGVCAATFSPAFAAPAVRSLGGAGTYSGVSSATAAKANGASSTGAKTVRASAVRSTAANLGSVKSGASDTTSTRVASTPRLSIGKYLGGAVTAGGSTISKGEGTNGELAGSVDSLHSAIEILQHQIRGLHQSIVDAADDEANAGFVIAKDKVGANNFVFELSVPTLVEHIKDDLSGQLAGNVEMQYNTETGYIQYKDAEGEWVDLITVPETGDLDEMAAKLSELEEKLNDVMIPGLAEGLAEMEDRLAGVESAVAGELQTEAKSIVAAINELKAKADNAMTSENLETLNKDMDALTDVVLGTDATAGLVGSVGALTESIKTVEDALEGKISNPGACDGISGICVLTYNGTEYKWIELQMPTVDE